MFSRMLPRLFPLVLFCASVFTLAQADTWDGWLVGLNAGMASTTAKYQTGPDDKSWFNYAHQTAGMWANGHKTKTDNSAVAGLSLAYNRQTGALVYGGEMGFDFADISLGRSTTYPYSQNAFGYQYNYKQNAKLNGLLTLKGRAGYAFGNSLLSATAGAAWTQLRTGMDYMDSYTSSFQYSASHEKRDLRRGWTAGITYQYKLPSNLILKAEYQYFDFGRSSFNTPVHAANGQYIAPMNFSAKVDMNMFTVGVEKQF